MTRGIEFCLNVKRITFVSVARDNNIDLLHLIEITFDRKRIYANPNSYPNSNPYTNPKAQLCFQTDETT